MKFIRKIRFVILIFIVAFIIISLNIIVSPSHNLILFLSPYICPNATYFVETQNPVVAITIDDSPSDFTSKILETLKKHNVKATFFPISSKVEKQSNIIKQIISQNHEIGNHLTVDEPSIKLRNKFESELLKADKILSEFATPVWLRPGYGFCNSQMVKTAKKHDYKIVLGSIWSYDTHLLSPQFSSWFILRNIHPGAIIVLHDTSKSDRRGEKTIETLNIIIPQLKERGYQFATLTELVESTQKSR